MKIRSIFFTTIVLLISCIGFAADSSEPKGACLIMLQFLKASGKYSYRPKCYEMKTENECEKLLRIVSGSGPVKKLPISWNPSALCNSQDEFNQKKSKK